MELKHRAPIINAGNPFGNCFTGRKPAGDTLTSIVNSLNLGGTIALTGAWGTGKTTFLRMWKQFLDDQHYPTILLNAWKTEWAEDPLIAVIACIKRACKQGAHKEIWEQIMGILSGFVTKPRQMLSGIAEAALENYTGDLSKRIDDLTGKAFNEAVASFDGKEQSMEQLKSSLEKLAWSVNQGATDGKPLVFIIDELDRCKPDYAVRMLEVLKHFFEVQNIVFVCAVDKKHLEDSICGYYGSEQLNAAEYLRRFFDLEIELPAPDYNKFCQHLYKYFELDTFFENSQRTAFSIFQGDGELFVRFLASLGMKSNLSLRQLERITAFTKLTLQGKGPGMYYYPTVSLFVTYLRFFDTPFYQDLKSHTMTAQELLDRFLKGYGTMMKRSDSTFGRPNSHYFMVQMLGRLITSYNNDRFHKQEKLYDAQTKSTTLLLNSESLITVDELVEGLEYGSHGHDDYELVYLFNVLDLLKIDE